jgi:hypothetical protein
MPRCPVVCCWISASRFKVLDSALEELISFRNSKVPHASESLILRDAERFLWGRIGPARGARDFHVPVGLSELMLPIVVDYIYDDLMKSWFGPMNRIFSTHFLEAKAGNPLSAPGGTAWYDMGPLILLESRSPLSRLSVCADVIKPF